MVTLEIDLSALDELSELSSGKLDEAMEACVDRGAEIGMQAKLREIAKTDARPIPTRGQVKAAAKQVKAGKKVRVKGGRKNIGESDSKASAGDNQPAWERSGDWADGQRIEKTAPFVREIVTTGNAADYEAHLANLPVGALGINRTNKGSENARDKTETQLEAVVEQEIRNALNI